MILQSAKIENFKSIGKDNNVLYVDNTVTALIGKNESGKSNILEAIGRLGGLYSPLDGVYLRLLTRGQEEKPRVYLRFGFTHKDIECYPNAEGVTTLSYTEGSVDIEGGLAKLISDDEEMVSCIELIKSVASANTLNLNNSNIAQLRTSISRINQISSQISLSIFNDLSNAKSAINTSGLAEKKECINAIDTIISRLKAYYNLIPQCYYRVKEETLNDVYTFDEIKKLMDSENIFHSLMIVAGVDKELLFNAFQAPTDAAKKTYKKKVAEKLNKLADDFNEFYQQETVNFEFEIEGQALKFYVYTSGMYMNFSERSNGLKWYFNLFIDVKAKTTKDRPILFLLDEPGVYLHVNAQKRLIELFEHLCESGNQLVYTTHSPYMINGDNIFNVRAVEKGEDALSKIFRSIHSYNLNKETRVETLTPLTKALGMDLKYNIGPNNGKLNVIVEGVTDCMYMTAMMHYLGIDEESRPYIIPCIGVDAVHLIVSVMIGWGCEYKVVVDYDPQGYSQYKKITQKSSLTSSANVIFVNCKNANDENDVKGENRATTESLVDQADNDKLENKYDGTNDTKTLAAKEFLEKVMRGELVPSEKTIKNFEKLFVSFGIIK